MPGVTAPVLAWRPQPCNLWGLFVPRFPVLASCVQTPPGDRVAVPPLPHWSVWRTPRLSAQAPWEMCWTLPFCPQAPLAQSWRQGRVGCVGCPCGTPAPPRPCLDHLPPGGGPARLPGVISPYGPLIFISATAQTFEQCSAGLGVQVWIFCVHTCCLQTCCWTLGEAKGRVRPLAPT